MKAANGIIENHSYYHIYNKAIEERTLFSDSHDYEVFISYLRDYLGSPMDPEGTKQTFTVRGRTFRGTPHQHKNYLGQIELIAYSLSTDNFHLLLYQKDTGSLERFLRSLCTRYSIYYNKKHHHSGSVYVGPYKSVQIKDMPQLLLLTHYLHHSPYSSYPEYLGKRESSWVNTKVVLSIKELTDYRQYVEKYELNQQEKELLEAINPQNKVLERKEVKSVPDNTLKANSATYLKPLSRTPEVLGFLVVYLFLTGLGLWNVYSSSNVKNVTASTVEQSPVLSATTQVTDSPSPTPSPNPKTMVVVKITDGAQDVNIRQSSTTSSTKVGTAKDGDSFEFVSEDSGWYEIIMADGSGGYISSRYAFPVEPINP